MEIPLLEAAKGGQLEAVKSHIRKRADSIKETNDLGVSIVHTT